MSKAETRNHLLWPLQLSICKMAIIMDYVRSIFSFLVLFLVTEFTDLLVRNSQSETACGPWNV